MAVGSVGSDKPSHNKELKVNDLNDDRIQSQVFKILDHILSKNGVQARGAFPLLEPKPEFTQHAHPYAQPSGYPQQFASEPLTQAEEIRQLKQSTETLHRELEQMRRVMNELRISSSEKDAEIIKLTMHLQDQRHFQAREPRNRDLFPLPNASGFNTVAHSKSRQELVQPNKFFSKRNDSIPDESAIIEAPSLITSQTLGIESEPDLVDQIRELKLKTERLENEKRQLEDKIKKSLPADKSTSASDKAATEKVVKENEGLKKENQQLKDEIKKALQIHGANLKLKDKNDKLQDQLT